MGAATQGKLPAVEEQLVEATVAPRRTVRLEGGRTVGPGTAVQLPAAEVERLQAAGFLVRPGEVEVATGQGPTFAPSDGPTVTESAA